MKNLLKEAAGYAAASGCALLLDMTILWSLVHYLSVEYVVAATISFLAGSIVAYHLSIHIAFKHHRLLDRRAEFLTFVMIGAAGLTVNAAVIYAVVKYLGLHFMFAKFIAAGFTFSCNFLARRQLLFVRRLS
jgi:putative flippase GtrA